MNCLIWGLWMMIAPFKPDTCQTEPPLAGLTSSYGLLPFRVPDVSPKAGQEEASPRFRSPLAQPLAITSPYGMRYHPLYHRLQPHQGVDIRVPVGTPVLASASGEVVQAEYDARAGRFITLRHPDGWYSRYLHLDHLLARPGQKVAKGEMIALSGNSGNSTGPHLHFELGHWKVPLNPLALLTPDGAPVANATAPQSLASEGKDQQPKIILISQGEAGVQITVRFNNKIRNVSPGEQIFEGYRVINKHGGRYQIVSVL